MRSLYYENLYNIMNYGLEDTISSKLKVVYDVILQIASSNRAMCMPIARCVIKKLSKNNITIDANALATSIVDFTHNEKFLFLMRRKNMSEQAIEFIASEYVKVCHG